MRTPGIPDRTRGFIAVQVKEQRKGLVLAHLFPKPRPVWATPAFIGAFGDAFIENTGNSPPTPAQLERPCAYSLSCLSLFVGFEGSSCLAHSYSVLNYALYETLKSEGLEYLAGIRDEVGRCCLVTTPAWGMHVHMNTPDTVCCAVRLVGPSPTRCMSSINPPPYSNTCYGSSPTPTTASSCPTSGK